MRTWFISRHPGAVAWAREQALPIDHFVAHLDLQAVQPGDTVIGTLPVNRAAVLCERGIRYLHLSLELPAHLRGQELSADQLRDLGATLQQFDVRSVPPQNPPHPDSP